VLDGENLYRWGNYTFMLAGSLLLGFMGAVHVRLRRADASGVLATVAVLGRDAADAHLAVRRRAARLRRARHRCGRRRPPDLGAWDAVAPYSLAFSVLPRLFFVGAIVLGLRMSGEAPWLQRIGTVLLPLSLVGSATLVAGAFFPLLALSTLGYELWVGALAWHWLRSSR
jgi:hypothetical protein